MQKFGCNERLTQIVCQLNDGIMAQVTDNGAVSEAFAVTNGVEQVCVPVPTLFTVIFSAMLMDACRDERPGIRIAYMMDGHLLNQRRMHFRLRVSTATVQELLFADDCTVNTTSEGDTQMSTNLFAAACENIGLVINTKTVKTGATIFESNHITAVKAKPKKHKSQLPPPPPPPPPLNANAQPSPTCPRCQWTFRGPIELVGHLRTNCSTRAAPTIVSLSTSPSPSTPSINVDKPPESPLPSSSSSSSLIASTSAAVVSAMPINTTHNPDTPTNTYTTTVKTNDEDPVYTCPLCDRTFISPTGLVGLLRIHCTESGEPCLGPQPTLAASSLHFLHCTRTFIPRMGLLGHMRVHENVR
ncbi:hypothetical protein SprV_0702356600 [Sparganum proliferum]